MITEKELNTMVLAHRHGGNGYVMVHDHGDDYCHVSILMKGGKIAPQAFLAWKPCLAVDKFMTGRDKEGKAQYAPLPIPDGALGPIASLRSDIAFGKVKIQATRFVK